MNLERRIERHALRTKDQLMKVLAMPGADLDARANIRRNKSIVEDRDARHGSRPGSMLKLRGDAAGEAQHDMRGIRCSEAMALQNKIRVAGTKRT